MKGTVALITGVMGQDGLYMAEFLLSKGYEVIGVVRDIQKARLLLSERLQCIDLVEWNMLDQETIDNIILNKKPDEIYNYAAYSTGLGMYDSPIDLSDVNGLGVVRILEAMRKKNSPTRFCQASSREIFGEPVESPQNEYTKVNPRSPYGAAKLYADSMIKIYRKQYGMFACSAILFNHESPRRGESFVTRKITRTVAKIKLGLAKELHLGSLDAKRDWGFAGDYIKAMWCMLQQEKGDDYILATGEEHTVREFCQVAFARLGLDYREYVREDSFAIRPNEQVSLVGDFSKAKNELGWIPKVGFEELVGMMVDADMRCLNKSNR